MLSMHLSADPKCVQRPAPQSACMLTRLAAPAVTHAVTLHMHRHLDSMAAAHIADMSYSVAGIYALPLEGQRISQALGKYIMVGSPSQVNISRRSRQAVPTGVRRIMSQ